MAQSPGRSAGAAGRTPGSSPGARPRRLGRLASSAPVGRSRHCRSGRCRFRSGSLGAPNCCCCFGRQASHCWE
eukprot:13842869-Alexandrium_andersonii.AAC.1